MGIRKTALAALSSAAFVGIVTALPARAEVVATISGSYDLLFYDTIGLTFHNTSGGNFINSTLHLHAYQGLNNGDTADVNLGTVLTGDTNFTWGGSVPLPGVSSATVPHNLTAYDYDDEYGGTPFIVSDPRCTISPGLCAFVGNFDLTFEGTIAGGAHDGQHVFSVFSPHTNFTGGFVGFEGLNPDGLSEVPQYDAHVGSVTDTLAVISIGFPPGVPEPSLWSMLMLGTTALGGALRRARANTRLA